MLALICGERAIAVFSSLPPINRKKYKKEAKELSEEEAEQLWQAELKRIRNSGSLTANELLDRAAASRRENRKDFDDYFIPDFEERSRRRKWSDPKVRATAANEATSLQKDDRYADQLNEGFNKFGLDPSNPHSWRTLLEFFVLAHFEKHAKNIGRRKWTTQSYCQLLTDYFVMRTKYPDKPATYVCDRLVGTAAYEHLAVRGKRSTGKGANLRRALYNAHDETKNRALQYLTEFHLKQLQQSTAADNAKSLGSLRKTAKKRAIRDIVLGDYFDHLDVVLELVLPEI